MIRGAAFNSKSLVSLKIGNNIITPDEAMSFLEIFTAKPKGPLQELDMENIYVNKDFVPVRVSAFLIPTAAMEKSNFQIMNRQRKRGKIITIGGVLKNYEIHGPDVRKLLFERGRYLGMKPKKKKKKKDFGLLLKTSVPKREKTVPLQPLRLDPTRPERDETTVPNHLQEKQNEDVGRRLQKRTDGPIPLQEEQDLTLRPKGGLPQEIPRHRLPPEEEEERQKRRQEEGR